MSASIRDCHSTSSTRSTRQHLPPPPPPPPLHRRQHPKRRCRSSRSSRARRLWSSSKKNCQTQNASFCDVDERLCFKICTLNLIVHTQKIFLSALVSIRFSGDDATINIFVLHKKSFCVLITQVTAGGDGCLLTLTLTRARARVAPLDGVRTLIDQRACM